MPTDPTLLDLDALAAAVERMSPAPWHWGLSPAETRTEVLAYFAATYDGGVPGSGNGPIHVAVIPDGDKPLQESALFTAITGNGPTSKANALGIVALVAAAPALLARCREVAGMAERIEALERGLREALMHGREADWNWTKEFGQAAEREYQHEPDWYVRLLSLLTPTKEADRGNRSAT